MAKKTTKRTYKRKTAVKTAAKTKVDTEVKAKDETAVKTDQQIMDARRIHSDQNYSKPVSHTMRHLFFNTGN